MPPSELPCQTRIDRVASTPTLSTLASEQVIAAHLEGKPDDKIATKRQALCRQLVESPRSPRGGILWAILRIARGQAVFHQDFGHVFVNGNVRVFLWPR